jgi:large subunit ribosomal protein L17
MITLGKKGTLSARRRAFALLCDHNLVKLLFDTIAPKFTKRNGGYTRLIPYRKQRGDNSELAILELTERYEVKKLQKEVKEAKVQKQPEQRQEKEEIAKEEKPVKEAPVKETKVEEKIEKEKPKEKPQKKEIREEKQPPKQEDIKKPTREKKGGGLFKGFRGLFKKDKE